MLNLFFLILAIKIIKKCGINPKLFQQFEREISILSKINYHINIVNLFGISYNEKEFLIIQEYCEGGTLFNLLHGNKNRIIPWKIKLEFIKQIAEGMQLLHSLNIIHRDLKSLKYILKIYNLFILIFSILLSSENIYKTCLKISDFGLSRALSEINEEKLTGSTGTIVNYIYFYLIL